MTRIQNMNLREVNNKIGSLKDTLRRNTSQPEYGMRPEQVMILLEMAEARRQELLDGTAP